MVISSIVDSVFCVFKGTGERERCGAHRCASRPIRLWGSFSVRLKYSSLWDSGLVNLSLTYLDSLRGCCIVTHTALKFIPNEVVCSNNWVHRFTNAAQTGCAVNSDPVLDNKPRRTAHTAWARLISVGPVTTWMGKPGIYWNWVSGFQAHFCADAETFDPELIFSVTPLLQVVYLNVCRAAALTWLIGVLGSNKQGNRSDACAVTSLTSAQLWGIFSHRRKLCFLFTRFYTFCIFTGSEASLWNSNEDVSVSELWKLLVCLWLNDCASFVLLNQLSEHTCVTVKAGLM